MGQLIDLYCERLGPGLLTEPLNALTNLAFLVAAWVSWDLARRRGALGGSTAVLLALMVSVGIGSALFHTFATTWARVLDVVPILIFQLFFLWLYLKRVLSANSSYSAMAVAGFLIAALVGRLFPTVLNGSVTYLPALALLIGLGAYHYKAQKEDRLALIAAAGALMLSLVFRSMDQAVCPYIPLGTHFLWHVLNGVVLYLAFRGLVSNWRR
ncbi:MAG: hypothetical protein EXR50_03755 [Dehalococcoidia bacterium]|nr:hypothetical protein [Dehalococcoidia bacterium]